MNSKTADMLGIWRGHNAELGQLTLSGMDSGSKCDSNSADYSASVAGRLALAGN